MKTLELRGGKKAETPAFGNGNKGFFKDLPKKEKCYQRSQRGSIVNTSVRSA
jgi:hypothetical protein